MLFTGSKKIWLRKSRLYLVLDAQVNSYDDLLRIGCEAARAGVDILQIRDKNGSAKDIAGLALKLMRRMKPRIPLIINDRVDVAYDCGADGVHLGQDDLSIATARRILGEKVLIGRSCQTWAHVQAAVKEGADYIGLGSIFKTQTKPDRQPMNLKLLKRVIEEIDFGFVSAKPETSIVGRSRIPVFAIGGITVENIGYLRAIGVKRTAVTRAVSRAKNIAGAVKILKG